MHHGVFSHVRRAFAPVAGALAALIVGLACVSASAAAPAPAEAATDRLLVKFRSSSAVPRVASAPELAVRDRVQALAIRRATALKYVRTMYNGTHSVRLGRFMKGAELAAVVSRLAADPDVERVGPDRIKHIQAVPNDPRFGETGGATNGQFTNQWYLLAPNATLVSPINAPLAWDLTRGSSSVPVAVIDTGILYRHPDLGKVADGGKLLPGYDMIGPDNPSPPYTFAVANDGDGADPDPTDPGDWINTADQSNPVFSGVTGGCPVAPSSWHGTKVAGVIGAATNDGIGIAGVGWNTPIVPVRALGKCIGYDSDIIDAMAWAGGIPSVPYPDPSTTYAYPQNTHPARVLNLSLGSVAACSTFYQDAINTLTAAPYNAVIVVAAGNGSATDSSGNGAVVTEPANCTGVIAVSALRHAGTKVAFSNFGPEVTVSAPGGNCVNTAPPCYYSIVSTSNSGVETATDAQMGYVDGNQATITYSGQSIVGGGEFGTSFSAPMVSGVVALMLSVNPALSPSDVRNLLQKSARPFPPPPSPLPANGPQMCPTTVPAGTGVAECYCPPPQVAATTTSPASGGACGAGMLDAYQAVLAAFAAAGVTSPPSLGPPTAVSPPVIPPLPTAPASSSGGGGGTSPWWILPILVAAGMRARTARGAGAHDDCSVQRSRRTRLS